MEQQELWALGTAQAAVQRVPGQLVTVRLHGAVTAMVFEAVHMRLGRERPGLHRALVIGCGALLVVTALSAVEASRRATPATTGGRCHVCVGVSSQRLRWAREYCALMTRIGLSRSAFVVRGEPARPDQLRLDW